MRFVRALVAFWVIAVCAGCEEEPHNLREWTAEDHLQPPQPDPSRAPAGGQGGGQPVQATEAQIAAAAASLFEASCASCHGVSGSGDGPQAPVAEMPNLATAEWHAANTDADIARAIRMGQGAMPAFGNQLNERGIAALVAHVRTLNPAAPPEGAPPEDAGDDTPTDDAPSGATPSDDGPSDDTPSPHGAVAPSPPRPAPGSEPAPAEPEE